jgi:hypothetical protein
MSNWSRPAILQNLRISDVDLTAGASNGIDLSGGFISFQYFETLLSPHITATIHFIDTGKAVLAGETQDAAERLGTIHSSVPTLKNKNLHITINHPSDSNQTNSQNLDFETDPLVISDIITRIEGTKTQLIGLKLVSKYARDNKKIHIDQTFTGNIKNNVDQILLDNFETTLAYATTTSTPLTIEGQGRNPFELILDMAREAVPATPHNAQPGCFFFETLDGFNFRGIDDLINQPNQFAYLTSDVATFCERSNFRILDYNVRSSMRNMLSSLETGEAIKQEKFDPLTFEYNEEIFPVTLNYSLGSDDIDLENLYNGNTEYSNTFTDFLDISPIGIGTEINNNPSVWRAKSLMRYNILFSKIIDIVVPCNLALRAGQVIQCGFPKNTDRPEEGISDETVSGDYLILNLSHKFTADGQTGSTTHMTIVRDTDGIYRNTEV